MFLSRSFPTKPVIALAGLSLTTLVRAAVSLSSPDGHLTVSLALDAGGRPTYTVSAGSDAIVTPSKLGLDIEGEPASACVIDGESRTTHDETWRPVCGERSVVRDHYNEVTVKLKDAEARETDIVFRAYDEGVAFRYVLPARKTPGSVVIRGELSEFRFAHDFPCFATTAAQGLYSRVPLSHIKLGTERPLVVETGAGYVALGEAGLDDFARMKFAAAPAGDPGVIARLDSPVSLPASAPAATPWRVIQVANSPGGLLENDALYENLNPPCAIADTAWIKPGTVLREVTLTTDGARRTIDFCAAHRVGYMLFDAGWYGDEWSPKSDASRVDVDPKRSKGPLDLPEVIRYGKTKGVGIVLYVNAIAMAKQLDRILPLYRDWGVAGVKYGFVPVGDQKPTAFIARAIRMAADNRLMVDIHDEWRPTGIQRTWPNLMTAEGIRGDEEGDRKCAQSLTHLFTRFLVGPADNTVCYFDPRVDRLCDHAYQLGKSVCFFSPWQTIYWYDRPAAPGETTKPGDKRIGDEPDIAFFDRLPTVWDETRVLEGVIGDHAVVARRSGESWRVGIMNADTPRTVNLKTGFLTPGRSYEAVVYTNDPATPTRTHVKIEKKRVTAGSALTLEIGANSGAALEITPIAD